MIGTTSTLKTSAGPVSAHPYSTISSATFKSSSFLSLQPRSQPTPGRRRGVRLGPSTAPAHSPWWWAASGSRSSTPEPPQLQPRPVCGLFPPIISPDAHAQLSSPHSSRSSSCAARSSTNPPRSHSSRVGSSEPQPSDPPPLSLSVRVSYACLRICLWSCATVVAILITLYRSTFLDRNPHELAVAKKLCDHEPAQDLSVQPDPSPPPFNANQALDPDRRTMNIDQNSVVKVPSKVDDLEEEEWEREILIGASTEMMDEVDYSGARRAPRPRSELPTLSLGSPSALDLEKKQTVLHHSWPQSQSPVSGPRLRRYTARRRRPIEASDADESEAEVGQVQVRVKVDRKRRRRRATPTDQNRMPSSLTSIKLPLTLAIMATGLAWALWHGLENVLGPISSR